MGRGRLEAICDGVLAITTIMALEPKAPHEATVDALRPLVPEFLVNLRWGVGHVISFHYSHPPEMTGETTRETNNHWSDTGPLQDVEVVPGKGILARNRRGHTSGRIVLSRKSDPARPLLGAARD